MPKEVCWSLMALQVLWEHEGERRFLKSIAHLARHERCRQDVGVFPGKDGKRQVYLPVGKRQGSGSPKSLREGRGCFSYEGERKQYIERKRFYVNRREQSPSATHRRGVHQQGQHGSG